MFTITIHLQADDLSMLTPLAQHLGHIEVAIDSPVSEATPPRQPHPAVVMIDEIEREEARAARKPTTTSAYQRKLDREADRKRKERELFRTLSPRVIRAVPCSKCESPVGTPCRGPSGLEFGFTGHTHTVRRELYKEMQS